MYGVLIVSQDCVICFSIWNLGIGFYLCGLMILAIGIWVVSLVFLLGEITHVKEEFEKILIDSAWESYTSLKVFKTLFAVIMFLFAPFLAAWLIVEYIRD